ncbi:MAG: hypothetical protein AAFV90_26265 [Cyanobacteria bacterium J06634_5]
MKNQFHSTSSFSQTQRASERLFKNALRAVLRFMVLRPETSAQQYNIASKDRYSSKAGRYVYLPAKEEQRDWLERVYHAQ